MGNEEREPGHILEAIGRWMKLPAEQREFVLFDIVATTQQVGKLADNAGERKMMALAKHYRDNQHALELAATILGFASSAANKVAKERDDAKANEGKR